MQGWARDTTQAGPAEVRVVFAGQIVAEAIANTFRESLLRSGRGHGYHAFHARLRMPLPPGPRALELHLRDACLHSVVDVPVLLPPVPIRVEELLRTEPGWTTAHVLAHPGCLDLAANCRSLGPLRFVDAVFRFALARWPTKAEVALNVADLLAGRITPEGLLLDCLRSRERADMDAHLPGPYDAEFGFRLPTDPSESPP